MEPLSKKKDTDLNSLILKTFHVFDSKKYPIKAQGQSTSEYSLILGLAVIICIVSLNNIGSEVTGLFNNMIVRKNPTTSLVSSNPSTGTSVITTTAGTAQGGQQNPTTPSNGLPTAPINRLAFNPATQNLNTLGIKTFEWQAPDGKKHQFKVEDANRILETTGPNGLTNAYLAQLDTLVDALKDALPANDPTLIEFEALALKGHEIASAQRNMAGIFTNMNNVLTAQSAKEKAARETNFMCPKCSPELDNIDLTALEAHLGSMTSTLSAPENPAQAFQGAPRGFNTGKSGQALLQFMIKATQINQTQLNQPQYADLKNIMNYFVGNIYQSASLTENDLSAVRQFNLGSSTQPHTFSLPPRETFIEANANNICAMNRGSTSCFRENGQAVQTAPPNTSPISSSVPTG